jgi:photosystem II stability/assembly factor-like uncharacterized protein
MACGAGSLAAVDYPGEEAGREQQIADLQKQIDALNKKLNELRAASATTPTSAVPDGTIPQEWINSLSWRSIGPANMGGRITAISVFEADPGTYWVATASGGLVKTVNNGITFDHQFDHEKTVSIGDVCVAPSDRNIVWVGTGEGNPRNSVSYGDGVYKSTDSGKTWKHMGLKDSYQIGKVLVHPTNPDIVYVGALGRLYGSNEERGLFKTTNGGQTWEKILYVDDKTGVIDMVMHPTQPDTLLVATWERMRDEFDDFLGEPPPPEGIERYDPVRKYGKGGGIYKTTDGGKTFNRLTKGLPTVAMGRIGLNYFRKNPDVVFAIIDTEKYGLGLPPLPFALGTRGVNDPAGAKITQVANNTSAARAELKVNDIVTSVDGKKVDGYSAFIELLRPHKLGDKVKLSVKRGDAVKEIEMALEAQRPMRGGFGGGGPGGGMRLLSLGFFGEDAEGGALVTTVEEQGAAAKAGLKVNDLVVTIDGKPVEQFFPTLRNLMSNHQAGDKIKLAYIRAKEKKEIEITLTQGTPGGFGRGGMAIRGHIPRPNGGDLGGNRENVQDTQGPEGVETGGVYKSTDGGESWQRVNSLNPRPMYFSVIRVDPVDDKIVWVCGVALYRSNDGGQDFERIPTGGVHDDRHAMWIDPHDGRHIIIGCDGGFYQSYDRAEHWDHLNHLALGQFYHVAVDPRPLYRVYGGLQDNGSWAGPAQSLRGSGPVNEDWIMLGGGDGFVCRVDPTDPDIVYSESQGGAIQRRNLRTGERAGVRPPRTPGKPPHRFNWNTPFILSNHNPSIFYSGGEYVFRSLERGDHLHIISPEITRTKKGSATALAESPRNGDVLWVGTDDGALWITRDGGGKWTDVTAKVGLPGPRWVASIEPSRYVEGRAYVAFDAHRSNDDESYVYVTEDFGQTWKSIRGNLPWGSTRVCREDVQNQNMLYTGTEFGAWVSVNRGASWTKLNHNLPTVAVHEFAQHPITGEVVAATHGRSLWVLDVTPLRQMTAETLKAKATLYTPNAIVRWRAEPGREGWFNESDRRFTGQNPVRTAQLFYSLKENAKQVSLKVQDHTGKTVSELQAKGEAGLHLVAWNLSSGRQGQGRGGFRGGAGGAGAGGGRGRRGGAAGAAVAAPAGGTRPTSAEGQAAAPATQRSETTGETASETAQAPPARQFGGGNLAGPGIYRVVLSVDGTELVKWLKIEADPAHPNAQVTVQDVGAARVDDDDDGDDLHP